MPRYCTQEQLQTISEMLNTHVVDDLKKLTGHLQKKIKKLSTTPEKLPSSKVPTRKAELVKWIETCLQDDAFIKALYQQLTPLEQAILQETVHSPNAKLDTFRFKAKYGNVPSIIIPSHWSPSRQDVKKMCPIWHCCSNRMGRSHLTLQTG
jgi:hypothetical protein